MKSNPNISAVLRSLRPSRTNIEKIILFGSAARGRFTEGSDLDLVIIEQTQERFVERSQKYYARLEVPCGVDMLVYTPEEFLRMKREHNPFIRRVVREGRIIYEKKPKARS